MAYANLTANALISEKEGVSLPFAPADGMPRQALSAGQIQYM